MQSVILPNSETRTALSTQICTLPTMTSMNTTLVRNVERGDQSRISTSTINKVGAHDARALLRPHFSRRCHYSQCQWKVLCITDELRKPQTIFIYIFERLTATENEIWGCKMHKTTCTHIHCGAFRSVITTYVAFFSFSIEKWAFNITLNTFSLAQLTVLCSYQTKLWYSLWRNGQLSILRSFKIIKQTHSMFKTAIQTWNLSTVKTISSNYMSSRLCYFVIQFGKWTYCLMADVNLFGGRGGAWLAVRVIRYHKPIANVLWTLSRLVKIICTLQINWVSTTAA